MKVAIERHGGFAGIKVRRETDAADLSSEQTSALSEVRRIGNRLPPDPGADRFTYKVEIADGGRVETFRVPESHFPPALRRIVTR